MIIVHVVLASPFVGIHTSGPHGGWRSSPVVVDSSDKVDDGTWILSRCERVLQWGKWKQKSQDEERKSYLSTKQQTNTLTFTVLQCNLHALFISLVPAHQNIMRKVLLQVDMCEIWQKWRKWLDPLLSGHRQGSNNQRYTNEGLFQANPYHKMLRSMPFLGRKRVADATSRDKRQASYS